MFFLPWKVGDCVLSLFLLDLKLKKGRFVFPLRLFSYQQVHNYCFQPRQGCAARLLRKAGSICDSTASDSFGIPASEKPNLNF